MTQTSRDKRGDGGHLVEELERQRVELETWNQRLMEAQEALERSRQEYFSLFEFAPVGYFVIAPNGAISEVNTMGADMLGEPKERLIGRLFSLFLAGASRETFLVALKRASNSGRRETCTARLTGAEGQALDVQLHLWCTELTNRPLCKIAVADITEIKRVEMQRRKEQDDLLRLHKALEQSGEGVIITDREGLIRYVNPAFARMTGYLPSDLEGAVWTRFKSVEENEALHEKVKATVLKRGIWSGRMKARRQDGSAFDADVSLTLIRGEGDELVGLVAVARDITEELRSERQMTQLQKMEAIGTATGGIAHDFNNMLAAILGNIELALDDVSPEMPARQNLDQALEAAMRGRDLVRKLLAFSRRSEKKVSAVHLNKVIDDTYPLARVTVPKTVEMKVTERAEEDAILADPIDLQQVLMNLCTNAADAMGEKTGLLEITVENAELKQDDAELGLSPGKYVLLTVRDTGMGMSDNVKEHLFEPFFTTKPEGKGTGMGLSVVYGIVQSYRGAIRVESEPGKGTSFAIYLPVLGSQNTLQQDVD